ncbi:MAG: DUF3039 domain-containing protein [Propionibacteriaceae bacterium]|nr:DUF3039 domain-containing protein [Propionibacteriaceae bacterium]
MTNQTSLAPGSQTVLDREAAFQDEDDHDRYSHFVDKEKLTEAMVMGTAVVALCGKIWVPSRNPEKYPVCPQCREIWESLPTELS